MSEEHFKELSLPEQLIETRNYVFNSLVSQLVAAPGETKMILGNRVSDRKVGQEIARGLFWRITIISKQCQELKLGLPANIAALAFDSVKRLNGWFEVCVGIFFDCSFDIGEIDIAGVRITPITAGEYKSFDETFEPILRDIAELQSTLDYSKQSTQPVQPIHSQPDPLPINGPIPPNQFVGKNGKTVTLPPIPWRLLNCLWQKSNRSAPIDDVIGEVWESSDTSDDAIDAAKKRANQALIESDYGLSISQKNGYLSIS